MWKLKGRKNRRKQSNGKRENFAYFPPSNAPTCCSWRSSIKLHKFELGTQHRPVILLLSEPI
jgi:hypothetical protein